MIDQITFKNASAVENSDLELLTQFACRLAEHAGAEILPYFRQPVAVRNKLAETNDFDPVTIADQAAETVMRQLIKKHYPQHGILGEELCLFLCLFSAALLFPFLSFSSSFSSFTLSSCSSLSRFMVSSFHTTDKIAVH